MGEKAHRELQLLGSPEDRGGGSGARPRKRGTGFRSRRQSPSWYRDPAKTGRDGAAKTIAFYRPKEQPKTPKVRYLLGITENSKVEQGNKIGISLEYADLF